MQVVGFHLNRVAVSCFCDCLVFLIFFFTGKTFFCPLVKCQSKVCVLSQFRKDPNPFKCFSLVWTWSSRVVAAGSMSHADNSCSFCSSAVTLSENVMLRHRQDNNRWDFEYVVGQNEAYSRCGDPLVSVVITLAYPLGIYQWQSCLHCIRCNSFGG